MKKLIFMLLIAVATAGFVFALDTTHPPGVLVPEATMFGYGVDNCIVTPNTVLVQLGILLSTGFTALSNDIDSYAVRATENDNKPAEIGQSVDYWLRL